MTGWILIALLGGAFYVADTNPDVKPQMPSHMDTLNDVSSH